MLWRDIVYLKKKQQNSCDRISGICSENYRCLFSTLLVCEKFSFVCFFKLIFYNFRYVFFIYITGRFAVMSLCTKVSIIFLSVRWVSIKYHQWTFPFIRRVAFAAFFPRHWHIHGLETLLLSALSHYPSCLPSLQFSRFFNRMLQTWKFRNFLIMQQPLSVNKKIRRIQYSAKNNNYK